MTAALWTRDLGRWGDVALVAWLTLVAWALGSAVQYGLLRAAWWVVGQTVRPEWVASLPRIP